MKKKQLIDALATILTELDSDIPCDDLNWYSEKESAVCESMCQYKCAQKECWIRWAKWKVRKGK